MTRRMIFLWIAMLAFVASPTVAAELRVSEAQVRKEIVAVVEAQLAAFRAGDAARAYGLAAAALRSQTPQRRFVAILQANYPEIWGNTGAEFGLVRDDGTRARLLVRVRSDEGDASFDYVLVRERSGWRVGSVLRQTGRRKDDV